MRSARIASTYEEARRIVEAFSFELGFVLTMNATLQDNGHEHLIVARLRTWDRDNPTQRITIHFSLPFHLDLPVEVQALEAMTSLWEHEFYEALRYGGTRYDDPH